MHDRSSTVGRKRATFRARVGLFLVGLVALFTVPGLIGGGGRGWASVQVESLASETPRPLTVREVVEFRSFPVRAGVRLSPDGRWLAHTVEGPRRTLGATSELLDDGSGVWIRIRVVDVGTGRKVELTPDANSWSPAWSPTGPSLAFYSDREGPPELWVWSPSEGVRKVSGAVVWTAFLDQVPRWSLDGRSLVVKLLPEGRDLSRSIRRSRPQPPSGPPGDSVTVRVFRSDDPAMTGGEPPEWIPWRYGGDLAVVDVENGQVMRVVTGRMPLWWAPSPDGSMLAFSALRDVENERAGYGLYVVPMNGGGARALPGDVRRPFGDGISWSPRGRHLAYVSHGGVFLVDVEAGESSRLAESRAGWGEAAGPVWAAGGRSLLFADGTLWRLSLDGGGPVRVAEPSGRRVERVLARESREVATTPGGEWLVALSDPETGWTGFGRLDPGTGRVVGEHLEPGSFGGTRHVALTGDGRTLVSSFSATTTAPDLWLLDSSLRRARRLSTLNPAFDDVPLGTTRLLEWRTAGGTRLQGTLLLPPGHPQGDRLPMVVEVYGGNDGAAALHAFDRYRQLLATRGYAVLIPHIPLEVGRPMRGHADGVVPGVDRVVELGIVDPDRVGVYGHSYGGYGTVALLALSDRFSAGVASAAHGNLIGMFGRLGADGTSRTRWAESGQGRMGASPWMDPTTYVENSPVFRLDRIHAPLLMLHGSEDQNTPLYLAGEIFTGLRALGRTVELVSYEGEGHSWRAWRLANKRDYWNRVLDWFEEYL